MKKINVSHCLSLSTLIPEQHNFVVLVIYARGNLLSDLKSETESGAPVNIIRSIDHSTPNYERKQTNV